MKNITLEERFTVLRQLGRGGFSQVYKVEDKTQNDKIFALKILFSDITQANAALNVFNNEVEYLKKLHHNCIVRIVEDLIIDNHPAILMELVEGVSLQELIDKEHILDATEVLNIALQISAALLACHTFQIPRERLGLISETVLLKQYAIIHNDISAKNIIKEEIELDKPNYKLIDFGLSYVPSEITSGETLSKGTLEYYPPEKWQGDKVDTYSDIYSFGVVLYQMLAGQVPFPIDNYNDMYQVDLARKHHLQTNLPDLWEIRKEKLLKYKMLQPETPDYPYWLQQLIEKCLAKNPKERFRTGEELNRFLQEGRRGNLASDWTNTINHNEEEDWLKAYGNNTITSLEGFIHNYPNSKYITKAVEEINYLKTIKNKEQKEDIDWQKALDTYEIEAFEKFIEAYPHSDRLGTAHQHITKIRGKINAINKEREVWQKTQNRNTKKAYRKFIKAYPNSVYIPLAKEKLSNLTSSNSKFFITLIQKILLSVLMFITGALLFFTFKDTVQKWWDTTQLSSSFFNEEKYTKWITKYYISAYIKDDFQKQATRFIHFPVKKNGNEITEKEYKKMIIGRNKISVTLKGNTSFIKKTIEIDSLVFVKKTNPVIIDTYLKVYGYKKSESGRTIKKGITTIREQLTIKNGKIIAFQEIEK